MSHPQSAFGGYPSWVPTFETDYPTHQDALLLAVLLVGGLAFITPFLTLTVGIPALALVALTGVLYGVCAIVLRRVIVGLYVSLIVTMTFAANVPLASSSYLSSFAGHLGPELWLLQLPLAGIVCYLTVTRLRGTHEPSPSRAEQVFGAFVVWAALSALLGAVVRVDAALYFVLFVAQGLIAFIVIRHAVQTDLIPFRTVVEIFALAVAAHAAIGIIQFFNRGILGVGALGELATMPIVTISLGPFGEFAAATYVSGFVEMSFLLAVLIVIAVPIALALALRATGWRRWGFVAAAVVGTAVIRVTGSDAARGALLVAVGSFAIGLGLLYRRGQLASLVAPAHRGRIQTAFGSLCAIMIAGLAFIYPSKALGSTSNIVTLTATNSGDTTNAPAPDAATVETAEAILKGLQVPFFDISTLGVRFQQYVAGIDLFLKYPLFGIGGGNFRYHAMDYGLDKPMPIHNVYIADLAQTGLPGFLFFIGTLALVALAGWRAIEQTENPTTRLLLVGVLAGGVGYLAFQFFGYSMLSKINTMMSFWVLAGSVVGLSRRD